MRTKLLGVTLAVISFSYLVLRMTCGGGLKEDFNYDDWHNYQ